MSERDKDERVQAEYAPWMEEDPNDDEVEAMPTPEELQKLSEGMEKLLARLKREKHGD